MLYVTYVFIGKLQPATAALCGTDDVRRGTDDVRQQSRCVQRLGLKAIEIMTRPDAKWRRPTLKCSRCGVRWKVHVIRGADALYRVQLQITYGECSVHTIDQAVDFRGVS